MQNSFVNQWTKISDDENHNGDQNIADTFMVVPITMIKRAAYSHSNP